MRERNYLYEYKLQGQDKPRLEKAVNVDFVPFIRGVRFLCKPRLIFSLINGPIILFVLFPLFGDYAAMLRLMAVCRLRYFIYAGTEVVVQLASKS